MLNGVVSAFQTGTYTVTRTTAPTRLMGRAVAGTPSTFTAAMSVQPVSGRELRMAPEGATASDVRVIYTTTELKTVGSAFAPDVITINGEPYTVYKVETFGAISGGHYRAYVARQTIP